MFSKPLGFIICLICLILPWRLRVIFGEILGWFIQLFYYLYYGIFNFLLTELRKAEEERNGPKK